jgi:hypothetical protein
MGRPPSVSFFPFLRVSRPAMTHSVDEEWEVFLTSRTGDRLPPGDLLRPGEAKGLESDELFREGGALPAEPPEPTPIYISTRTKLVFLNQPVLLDRFWDLPVISYNAHVPGIVKKIKLFKSTSQEQLDALQDRVRSTPFVDEQLLSRAKPTAANPTAFLDVRKISVGMSHKDLFLRRPKKTKAFANCFVIMLRVLLSPATFGEFHAKVFNTGKIEIPGVLNQDMFERIRDGVCVALQPACEGPVSFLTEEDDIVLINSNFHCRFFVLRHALHTLLRTKYRLDTTLDPCAYPGIITRFYYRLHPPSHPFEQTGVQEVGVPRAAYLKITFMVFRTGSVLIVGKCTESMLNEVYEFINRVFRTEFATIALRVLTHVEIEPKCKQHKLRTRWIDPVSRATPVRVSKRPPLRWDPVDGSAFGSTFGSAFGSAPGSAPGSVWVRGSKRPPLRWDPVAAPASKRARTD